MNMQILIKSHFVLGFESIAFKTQMFGTIDFKPHAFEFIDFKPHVFQIYLVNQKVVFHWVSNPFA